MDVTTLERILDAHTMMVGTWDAIDDDNAIDEWRTFVDARTNLIECMFAIDNVDDDGLFHATHSASQCVAQLNAYMDARNAWVRALNAQLPCIYDIIDYDDNVIIALGIDVEM